MDNNPREQIGGNQPPAAAMVLADLREYLIGDDATLAGLAAKVAEALPSMLDETASPLVEKIAKFDAVFKLWEDQRPDIADGDQAEKATNFAAQLNAHDKAIREWHKGTKEPFLRSGRLVDGASNVMLGRVAVMSSSMIGRLNRWQRKIDDQRKAEAERLRLQAEAAQQRAQAEAEEGHNVGAEAAQQRAEDLRKQASEVAAGPVQVRSDHGAMATQRKSWKFEITDAAKVPKAYLSPDADKIKAAIKAADDPSKLDIKGVRIYLDIQTQVRG